jgi:hypothetical protein
MPRSEGERTAAWNNHNTMGMGAIPGGHRKRGAADRPGARPVFQRPWAGAAPPDGQYVKRLYTASAAFALRQGVDSL